MPAYSVSTPPVKGLQVKIILPQQYVSTTNLNTAFSFNIVPKGSIARLLVEGYSNSLVA